MTMTSTVNPPVGKRWHTREDSGIELDAQLRWWHDGEPIEHPRIIEIFNTSLVPAEGGRFQLRVGQDWCFVQVADAAYEVRAVDADAQGQLGLRLSDRSAELLVPSSLQADGEGRLSCQVKEGQARARFSREAQAQLGAFLEMSEEGQLVLNTGKACLPLPSALLESPQV